MMKINLRKCFLPAFFVCTWVGVAAQPAVQWTKAFPDVVIRDMVNTSDGGYFLGGSKTVLREFNQQPATSTTDYWVAKVTSTGNISWEKTFGGPDEDILQSISTTADGGFIVNGSSLSGAGGEKMGENRGDLEFDLVTEDLWVVKLTSSGTIEWERTLGGGRSDISVSIDQLSDGGFVAASVSTSKRSVDKSEDVMGNGDYWIIKLDASGKTIWENTIGGPGGETLKTVALMPDGSMLLAGTSSSGIGGDKTEPYGGPNWLVKVSAAGSIEWDKTLKDLSGQVTVIHPTSDGGYIMGGEISLPTTFNDYWVAKLDADFTKQWVTSLSGTPLEDSAGGISAYERLNAIFETRAGEFIIGGESSSGAGYAKSENNTGNVFNSDLWVVKLSANGQKIWDRNYGGPQGDYLYAMTATSDGGYMMACNPLGLVKLFPEAPPATTLSAFTARRENAFAELTWQSASEINSEYFEIQHSTDWANWEVVDKVTAKGESSQQESYAYEHKSPALGENHYRLRMVGADGNYAFSKIVHVRIPGNTAGPFIAWDHAFGGNAEDRLLYADETDDGGYILGGVSASSQNGDKSGASSSEDIWIVRLDADRKIVWEKTFGCVDPVSFGGMVKASDGGYLIGATSSSGIGRDRTVSRKGLVDFWVLKISDDGVKEWDKAYGGPASQYFRSITPTSDGGYMLGGESDSGIGLDKSQASRGRSDYWIVKVNAAGTKQWDKTFGTPDFDTFNQVIQTRDGGYLLAGHTLSNIAGDKTENSKGNDDYWILKLKPDGTKQWDKTIGGDRPDLYANVLDTNDGGFLIAGSSYSGISGDKTDYNKGDVGTDYWIVKVNADGNVLWDKTFGSWDQDNLAGLSLAENGFIIGGTSERATLSDYWIIKVDLDGNKIWEQIIGSNVDDHLSSLTRSSDGGYILGGYSAGSEAGYKTEHGKGEEDYWIVKVADITAPLPVTLTNFTAQKENKTALLTWQTATETHSDFFEVQHSTNGKSWNALEKINAKGTGVSLQNYQYVHVNPAPGEHLYRLRIVDTDGTFAFSGMVHLQFDSNFSLNIYPNPAAEMLTIETADWEKVTAVQLLDSHGVAHYAASKPAKSIHIKGFAPGFYFIRITKNDGSYEVKKVAVGR